MTIAPHGSAPGRALRLWPGILFAIVLVIGRYVVPVLAPDAMLGTMPVPVIGVFAGLASAAAILVWWLCFSRAAWVERLAAVLLIIAAVFALRPLVHVSILGGMMGNMVPVYSIPVMCLALAAWAVATQHLSTNVRRLSMVAAIALASVPFVLIRSAGVIGAGAELHWRWTPTPEERLVAQGETEPAPVLAPAASSPDAAASPAAGAATPQTREVNPGTPPAAPASAPSGTAATAAPHAPAAAHAREDTAEPEWPGFRGPDRDSVVHGVRLNTDWSAAPPVQLWRHSIGPGWSSFAVAGDHIYTQEQRGDDEIVSCYRLSTGDAVWRHRDRVRFYESNGGPGPRGTPTLHAGRVYSVGATGLVNALDAATGRAIWSRNAATDTGVTVPEWGVASSPLLFDDLVVVAVSGQLIAYDAGTGAQRWLGPKGGAGYSSPHLVTIDGVPQILLLRGSRTISVAPADGTLLWQHVGAVGVGIVQPAVLPGGDVIITVADAMGGIDMRRLAATQGPSGWTVAERWTSRGLKPYFNDYVVHDGYVYGFDGSILAAVSLEDGVRRWKGGRYGNGQMLLFAEQGVLLVMAEEGELALVSATPDHYKEIARFPALDAKTWNHPVVVGDVLLVRNGEEMAAFRLPVVRAALTSR